MKKRVIIVISILLILMTIKYFKSDYYIKYKINDYDIEEIYKNDYLEFKVYKDEIIYDYFYYTDRFLGKRLITSIQEENINDYICLTLASDKLYSYSLCNKEGNIVTREVATNSFIYEKENDNFRFTSLNNNEYMLIWKYDGFYYLNGDSYKSINLFNNNRYSNDLMFQIDNYLIFPKYEENNYLFTNYYVLDMTTGKYFDIDTKYSISYESYIAGNYKNSLFIYDNKTNNLYELNYKSKSFELVGNELRGYIKYTDNKKQTAYLNEYKIDKITYFNYKEKNSYAINNILYYNNDYKIKYNNNEVKVINTFNDNVYFIYNDNIYRKSNYSTDLIAHYFELNFNNNDIIYVYQK